MSKHTPGEWSRQDGGLTISTSINNTAVCYIEDGPDCEANALLVAAAPDLLKACVSALRWATSGGKAGSIQTLAENIAPQLEEAIKKATK